MAQITGTLRGSPPELRAANRECCIYATFPVVVEIRAGSRKDVPVLGRGPPVSSINPARFGSIGELGKSLQPI